MVSKLLNLTKGKLENFWIKKLKKQARKYYILLNIDKKFKKLEPII